MTGYDFSHFLIVTKVTISRHQGANRSQATHLGRGCFRDKRASSVLVLACSFSMIRLT